MTDKKKGRPKKPKFEMVYIGERCEEKLKAVGYKFEWIESLAHRYGFDKIEYLDKFKAFRCSKGGKAVDWIDINALGLLNNVNPKVRINQQYGKVHNPVIEIPWRR